MEPLPGRTLRYLLRVRNARPRLTWQPKVPEGGGLNYRLAGIPWHRPPGQVCNPRRLPPMRHPDRRSPVFLINILYGTSQTEGGILSQAWKTTSARPVSPRTRAESAPANCVIAKHPAEGPRQRVRTKPSARRASRMA